MTEQKDFWEKVQEAADEVAAQREADILLYNGEIVSQWSPDDYLINKCNSMSRRSNVVLVLVTYGGNPHVAYRIARTLQQRYDRFTIYIPGICMSAGTLITLGAHEIVMSDHGRLSPLDVQVYKPDELYEPGSGLDVVEAVDSLRKKTISMFRSTFLDLKVVSKGQITLKTAMETASSLTAGVFAPVYQQIDPMRLGEITRSMSIAEEYGTRLDARAGNLKDGMLDQLVAGYPSHTFVIDRDEAETLFRAVKKPTEAERALADSLMDLAQTPIEPDPGESDTSPLVKFISGEKGKVGKEQDEEQDDRGDTEGERAQSGSTTGDPGEGPAVEASPNGKRKNRQVRSRPPRRS